MSEAGPAPEDRPRGSVWQRIRRRWMSGTREAQEADEEQRSRRHRGTVPLSEVRERQDVVVSGILQSVTYSPASGPTRLIAMLYDGTGTIELRWLGRRTIPGITVGRHLEAHGTVARVRDHAALIDPSYRILNPEAV